MAKRKKHTQAVQMYEDRYNRSFIIPPGGRIFAIRLEDVRQAPRERQMEMQPILPISFFSMPSYSTQIKHNRAVNSFV